MDVNEYLEAKKKIAQFLKVDGKKAFLQIVQELFDNNPELMALCWTQETPEWNDGDACVFGVSDIFAAASIPTEEEWKNLYDGDDNDCWNKPMSAACEKAIEDFDNQLHGPLEALVERFGEGTIKVVRGPDNKVTVSFELKW